MLKSYNPETQVLGEFDFNERVIQANKEVIVTKEAGYKTLKGGYVPAIYNVYRMNGVTRSQLTDMLVLDLKLMTSIPVKPNRESEPILSKGFVGLMARVV